jgi:hypothetical protein
MIKNKLEKTNGMKGNTSEKPKFRSRVVAIYEISARNELPFLEVLPIYVLANYKIYSKYKKLNENSRDYNSKLEETVFRLTERIIENNRIRKADKYKSIRHLEEIGRS